MARARGIIPRLCTELFAVAQERLDEDPTLTIKITMSFLEIYNEKVRDLLEKKRKGQVELGNLDIRETPAQARVLFFAEACFLPPPPNLISPPHGLFRYHTAKKIGTCEKNAQCKASEEAKQANKSETILKFGAKKIDCFVNQKP